MSGCAIIPRFHASERTMGTIVNAKVILSDSRTLLRGRAVRYSRGVITDVDSFDSLRSKHGGDKVIDRPDAAILPGFTNAHCHLELDFCEGKISYNGNFIDWLQSIRDIKFGKNPPVPNPVPSVEHLIRSGTTTLVDHYTMDLQLGKIRATGIRYFPLKELFEFDNHDPDVRELASSTEYSFAVHAPYTASVEIALACKELADKWRRPISTHLSEMRAEIEFIKDKNEDIERLLRKADAYDENWKGLGITPIEHYFRLGILGGRTYCIHLNYWEDNDLYFLAQSGVTPVYCPKSHLYFGHPVHPIETYQRAGLKVALGTDSFASNDQLSLLSEAKLVIETFPEMPLALVLDALTVNGLRPLGLNDRLGRVKPGQIADLTLWDGIEGDTPEEVIHEVISTRDESALTVIGGKICHEAEA